MTYRLTKIYTGQGDQGYTRIGDKPVAKDDYLIDAVGTLDELNSAIGLVIAFGINNAEIADCLTVVQNELFDLGGELHLPDLIKITTEKVTKLEKILDKFNSSLPPLEEFLLPRGNPAAAACHLARTICRRAERTLVRLHRQVSLNNPQLIAYINRLSDLLFVIARVLARETQSQELMWEHQKA